MGPLDSTLPKDWTTTTILGASIKVMDYRGRTPRKLGLSWDGGTIPALSARNVRMGFIDFAEECHLGSEELYRRWMTHGATEEGDVLLTTEAPLGNVAAVPDARKYILSQRTVLLRPDPSQFDKKYFLQVLQSPRFQQLLQDNATGSTALGIQRKRLEKLSIPKPSLPEQRLIGNALERADRLIASIEQLITKKQSIRLGMMQQLLTGKTRLRGFSGDWDSKPLREIVQTPITDGPHLTPKFLPMGVPFLSVNNLVDGKLSFHDVRYISKSDHLEFSKKCAPRRGDILLGKAASVGKVALVETDIEFNIWSPIAMIRIRSEYDPKFVHYQLKSASVANQIALLTNTSSQGNIGMGDIGKLIISLPPFREQIAIASALADADHDIATEQGRLAKAKSIRQGMRNELLTGKTRLLPVEATL